MTEPINHSPIHPYRWQDHDEVVARIHRTPGSPVLKDSALIQDPDPHDRTPRVPARKAFPLATGCLDYFPDALAAIAEVSFVGNEQHNPGQPLHWDRSKSTDEADALMRHFIDRGTRDDDGMRHSAKVAWRALALLQKEIEAEKA
ncbi:MAG TPA: dATP/dGTP diphosphohydrolase domain-containing protein [Candidatus Saccharimonadales bacterium]|nr:dATP/dGTP diphosphohydrolase domain-containing protein [Candidatus Saccharimonadales bacterium]